MDYKLIGFKDVDFTTQDGNRITGVKLYFTYVDGYVDGEAAEIVGYYKPDAASLELEIGGYYSITYNKWGKVQSITKVG